MFEMIREGLLKRIHVNQHNIKHNAKNPDDLRPVFTCKTSSNNYKAHRVDVQGPSTLVYSPDKPLACGAKVWIETVATVYVQTEEEEEHDLCSSCGCILRWDEGDQCRWCEEATDVCGV